MNLHLQPSERSTSCNTSPSMLSTMLPASFHHYQQPSFFAPYTIPEAEHLDEHVLQDYRNFNNDNTNNNNNNSFTSPPTTSLSGFQQPLFSQRHLSISSQPSSQSRHSSASAASRTLYRRAPPTKQARRNPAGKIGQTRRRISRACDQCNQLRTKCDGNTPCAHCVEVRLTCEDNRERKKRGKASRKEIAARQAAASAAEMGENGPVKDETATKTNGIEVSSASPETMIKSTARWTSPYVLTSSAIPSLGSSSIIPKSSDPRYGHLTRGECSSYDGIKLEENQTTGVNELSVQYPQPLDLPGSGTYNHGDVFRSDERLEPGVRDQHTETTSMDAYQHGMLHAQQGCQPLLSTTGPAMFSQMHEYDMNCISDDAFPVQTVERHMTPSVLSYRLAPGVLGLYNFNSPPSSDPRGW